MTDLVTLAAALCAGEDVAALDDEEAPPKRRRARSGRVVTADIKLARAHGAPTNGCQDVARAHAEARRRAGRW